MRLATDRVIANLVPMFSLVNINKGNNLFQLQRAFSGGLIYSTPGVSTRRPRAACGPPASFVRTGKGRPISQNTMRYEY